MTLLVKSATCVIFFLSLANASAQDIAHSLDSIATSLQRAENDRLQERLNRELNSGYSEQQQAIYFQQVATQLQQRLIFVSNQAQSAINGWRASEKKNAQLLMELRAKEQEIAKLKVEMVSLIDKAARAEEARIVVQGTLDFICNSIANNINSMNAVELHKTIEAVWLKYSGFTTGIPQGKGRKIEITVSPAKDATPRT